MVLCTLKKITFLNYPEFIQPEPKVRSQQKREIELKSRGACIYSPNLFIDEAQLLRMVITELSEVICSPMALSKLALDAMKDNGTSQKKD